MCEQQFSITFG